MSLARSDWLFALAAWLLAAIGASLLLWALWGDWWKGVRFRRRTGERRRRCPKCWYDMAGVQTLTCPECGRDARRERRLHRSKRRRFLALFACLIAGAAYCVSRVPIVRKDGWPAAVPTGALVAALPLLDPPGPKVVSRYNPRGRQPTVREALWQELVTNHLEGNFNLPSWQRWWIVRLGMRDALAANPKPSMRYKQPFWVTTANQPLTDAEWRTWMPQFLPRLLRTRARWPEGAEVYVSPQPPLWMMRSHVELRPAQPDGQSVSLDPLEVGLIRVIHHVPRPQEWADGARPILLCALKTPALPLDLIKKPWPPPPQTEYAKPDLDDPKWQPHTIARYEFPVRVEGTIDECMRRVAIPAVDEALRCGTYSGKVAYGMLTVTLSDPATLAISSALAQVNATFAARLEVLRDGECIVSQRAWWSATGDSRGYFTAITTRDWNIFPPKGMRFVVEDHAWALRITPDQEVALRDYESERCWDGEPIEVPIEVRKVDPPKPSMWP